MWRLEFQLHCDDELQLHQWILHSVLHGVPGDTGSRIRTDLSSAEVPESSEHAVDSISDILFRTERMSHLPDYTENRPYVFGGKQRFLCVGMSTKSRRFQGRRSGTSRFSISIKKCNQLFYRLLVIKEKCHRKLDDIRFRWDFSFDVGIRQNSLLQFLLPSAVLHVLLRWLLSCILLKRVQHLPHLLSKIS